MKKKILLILTILLILPIMVFANNKEENTFAFSVNNEILRAVQSIVLEKENDNPIFPGDTARIIATITPEDSTNEPLTWSSLNENVATVSSEGVVTAIKAGTATIKAEASNGIYSTIDIEVSVRAEQITFNNETLIFNVGENFTLSNILRINKVPSSAVIDPITWSSSNPSVVSIDEDGYRIYANNVGTATITATEIGGQQATCEVTVRNGTDSVRIEPNYVELFIGETVQMNAIITPSGSSSYYTWSSNSPSVASIDSTGFVRALSVGATTIIVRTDNDKTAQATVVVKSVPTVQSLTFDSSELELDLGQSQQLNLTILPEDAVDKTITWSSNNPAIATVTDTGVVTAVKYGQATITAKSVNGVTASIVIKIIKNGFIREAFNGYYETFYYIDGVKVKGFREIDGKLYYFDSETGVLLKGWQTDGNFKWYQLSDGTVVRGMYTIDGKIYYFSNRGYLTTGFVTIDDKLYFFSRTYGYALKGWVRSEKEGTWYQRDDGSLIIGTYTIDGKIYYFDNDGKLTTGFITIGDKLYFFSRTYGYALKGWVRSEKEGTWYQRDDGSLITGIYNIDGKLYYFNEEGKLTTGFIAQNGKIYFFSRTYEYALKGWVKSQTEGTWYQLDDGSLITGKRVIDGKNYYFGEDGKLITGFVYENGKIYFYSRTYGYTLQGWVSNDIDGKWYQLEDGSLLVGPHTIDGKNYYFGEDGRLKTGFITIDGTIYFYSRTYGYTLKGWVSNDIDGKWYQNEDGSLLTGKHTINGKHYYFNEEGKLTTGFIYIDDKRYFFSRTYEYALQGWVVSNTEGVWYQLEDGSLVTGLQTIDGRDYLFGEDGILLGFL